MIPWGTPIVKNVLSDLQPFITQRSTTKVCPDPVSFGAPRLIPDVFRASSVIKKGKEPITLREHVKTLVTGLSQTSLFLEAF